MKETPVQGRKRQIEESVNSNILNTSLVKLNTSNDADYIYDYEAFKKEYYGEIDAVPVIENNTVIFNKTDNEVQFIYVCVCVCVHAHKCVEISNNK